MLTNKIRIFHGSLNAIYESSGPSGAFEVRVANFDFVLCYSGYYESKYEINRCQTNSKYQLNYASLVCTYYPNPLDVMMTNSPTLLWNIGSIYNERIRLNYSHFAWADESFVHKCWLSWTISFFRYPSWRKGMVDRGNYSWGCFTLYSL